MTLSSIVEVVLDLFHRWMFRRFRESLLLALDLRGSVAPPPHLYPIATTSSTLRTQTGLRRLEQRHGSRSTQLHSNVIFVQRSLPVHTTSGPIFARIRTRDHSFVACAPKRLPANTTARGTRGYIVVRRNSSAAANWVPGQPGAVGADSQERTLSAGISAAKLAECVSSHYSTKKLWRGSVRWTSK